MVRVTSRSSARFPYHRGNQSTGLLAGRREKEPLWTVSESSVLLNKACPQEKLTRAKPCWVLSEPNRPGERQSTTTASLAFLSHLRGEKNLINTCEAHSPETQIH